MICGGVLLNAWVRNLLINSLSERPEVVVEEVVVAVVGQLQEAATTSCGVEVDLTTKGTAAG
jgi:hypothetical protein